MSRDAWVPGHYDNVNVSSATQPQFFYLGGDHSVNITARDSIDQPVRHNGVFRHMSVYLGLEQYTGTLFLHINGTDGNLGIQTSGPTGQYEDRDSEDAVVANDLVCLRSTLVSGSGQNRYTNWKTEFENDGPDTVTLMLSAHRASGPIFQNNNADEFCQVQGILDETGSDEGENVAYYVRGDGGTWQGCYVWALTNSRVEDSQVFSRINAADGNQAVTVTAGMTGAFEDAASTDTVAQNDIIDWRVRNAGGGGTWQASTMSSVFGRSEECWQSALTFFAIGLNGNLERGNTLGGGLRYSTSSADFNQVVAHSKPVGQRFRRMEARVSANSLDRSFLNIWLPINDQQEGDNDLNIRVLAGRTGRFARDGIEVANEGDFVHNNFRSRGVGAGATTTRTAFFLECTNPPPEPPTPDLLWSMPIVDQVSGESH